MELLKRRIGRGILKIMAATTGSVAMVKSFSSAAWSMHVPTDHAMYGVPVPPIVKYGPPPALVSNITDHLSVGAIITIIVMAAVILVCAGVGLKFFLFHGDK